MEKITTILAKKEPHFHTISPLSSVATALNQMCCENVDYLVVIGENESFLGLISEHDIASRFIASNKVLSKTKVGEVMNKRLHVATTGDSVEKCIQLMRQHQIRHLPVFENFLFKGIVSSEDMLDEMLCHRTEVFDDEPGRIGRFGLLT